MAKITTPKSDPMRQSISIVRWDWKSLLNSINPRIMKIANTPVAYKSSSRIEPNMTAAKSAPVIDLTIKLFMVQI